MIKRVAQLHDIIFKATIELEQIKKDCVHPDCLIGWYQSRPGQRYISKICSDCYAFVDLASPKEQETFIQEEMRKQPK